MRMTRAVIAATFLAILAVSVAAQVTLNYDERGAAGTGSGCVGSRWQYADEHLSNGIALGAHFSSDAATWALHDGGDVALTKALDGEYVSVIGDIWAINDDFVPLFHIPLFGVHEYCKTNYDDAIAGEGYNPSVFTQSNWWTLAIDNECLMFTTYADTFCTWENDPNFAAHVEECRDAYIANVASFLNGSAYDTDARAMLMWDFWSPYAIPYWPGTGASGAAYKANCLDDLGDPVEEGDCLPDLDQDGIAFLDDLSYGGGALSEVEHWEASLLALTDDARDALSDNFAFINNGSSMGLYNSTADTHVDGLWLETFPLYYYGSPSDIPNYFDALANPHGRSLYDMTQRPYKTDRGGPYILLEIDESLDELRYAAGAICMLYDEVISVWSSYTGTRELWYPGKDFSQAGDATGPAVHAKIGRWERFERTFAEGLVTVFVDDHAEPEQSDDDSLAICEWIAYEVEYNGGPADSTCTGNSWPDNVVEKSEDFTAPWELSTGFATTNHEAPDGELDATRIVADDGAAHVKIWGYGPSTFENDHVVFSAYFWHEDGVACYTKMILQDAWVSQYIGSFNITGAWGSETVTNPVATNVDGWGYEIDPDANGWIRIWWYADVSGDNGNGMDVNVTTSRNVPSSDTVGLHNVQIEFFATSVTAPGPPVKKE